MTLKEALKEALVVLKQIMEEKLNATNVEVRILFKYPVCSFKMNLRQVVLCHTGKISE